MRLWRCDDLLWVLGLDVWGICCEFELEGSGGLRLRGLGFWGCRVLELVLFRAECRASGVRMLEFRVSVGTARGNLELEGETSSDIRRTAGK